MSASLPLAPPSMSSGVIAQGAKALMATRDETQEPHNACLPMGVPRANPYDKKKKHGFIDSQKMGLEVFRRLDPECPLMTGAQQMELCTLHRRFAAMTTSRS